MVPGIVLAASHACPGNVDRRFPLEKAHHLRHRVLRGNGEEHVHVIRHHVPLFNSTFLLLGQRTEDLPEMPPPLMGERFPTNFGINTTCYLQSHVAWPRDSLSGMPDC